MSWSVLLMQRRLAKAIKNTSRVTARKGIDRIDKQYSFNRLIGSRLDQIVGIKSFDDVSNINVPENQSPKCTKLLDASTRLDFRTMFLKKNIPK